MAKPALYGRPRPIRLRAQRLAKEAGTTELKASTASVSPIDGATAYQLACELGPEGIISKLKGSRYRPNARLD
jgi:ATP-dependent DNA ligase